MFLRVTVDMLGPPDYLTAPKVRPRTSWRWLIQPKTRMGAIAIVEAAESLAQNRPSGAENEAMNVVSGAALRGRQVQAPERLVPAQDDRQQGGRGDARQRQRQQQHPDLLLGLGAVHAAGLEDVLRHLLEEGVEHPDHDRQVHQGVDDGQAPARVDARRDRGTAGRSGSARRPPASSWSTASTAADPWSACPGRRPWRRPPARRSGSPAAWRRPR